MPGSGRRKSLALLGWVLAGDKLQQNLSDGSRSEATVLSRLSERVARQPEEKPLGAQ
jgi:hypothetical protein